MGGLSFTFPDPPKLTWEWTGVAGMGITGIAGALEEAQSDCSCKKCPFQGDKT